MKKYVLNFIEITKDDLARVGGKNASLGEMFSHLKKQGILVPDGFATTADAYWHLIQENNLQQKIEDEMKKLDTRSFSNLKKIGKSIRDDILDATLPDEISKDILEAYHKLSKRTKGKTAIAVRSSATAEDLPSASFAGQLESYLNIDGGAQVLEAFKKCLASLFTDRAIKYRFDNHFNQLDVALSVSFQLMVRSDLASSGVAFTLEPDTGFRDVVVINGIWGLGENIVQGKVNPDEFIVFKPNLKKHKHAIISQRLGSKKQMMLLADGDLNAKTTHNIKTPKGLQTSYSLTREEVNRLAQWCCQIEDHYARPMDIEWAKDGRTGEIFIVQARPETVHTHQNKGLVETYTLTEQAKPLTTGLALGQKINSGKARILKSPLEADKLEEGEVLVTSQTNPDWDPIMKKAAAIVTNKGGRTSHAAIVAREIGVVAVVGADNATEVIRDGQLITVSCAEGKVGKIYPGLLKWKVDQLDISQLKMPKTKPMLILGDPDKAFAYSFLPNEGIGLMRLEFTINNAVQIHPMALVKFDELKDKKERHKIEELTRGYVDKSAYFVDKLSQGVATIAAAFYPKDVIVRMSDFKTNEYAHLVGGAQFEKDEENPMIGFRGASRYYNPLYEEGFKLECQTMKKVREEMGFTNVKLMIPFCRTVAEGKKVIDLMEKNGLKRGVNGLEIYMMVEIPSNVILAEKFADIFDGFSIGTNDLTQLTLGLDRDNAVISDLFDERNEAVESLIATVIKAAHKKGKKIGLCGQAPSDHAEFAAFLIKRGISSISFNPDALVQGIKHMARAEAQMELSQNMTQSEKLLRVPTDSEMTTP